MRASILKRRPRFDDPAVERLAERAGAADIARGEAAPAPGAVRVGGSAISSGVDAGERSAPAGIVARELVAVDQHH